MLQKRRRKNCVGITMNIEEPRKKMIEIVVICNGMINLTHIVVIFCRIFTLYVLVFQGESNQIC